MQKWEYITLTLKVSEHIGYTLRNQDGELLTGDAAHTYIQQFGREGWELVSVVAYAGEGAPPDQCLWFKRPIER